MEIAFHFHHSEPRQAAKGGLFYLVPVVTAGMDYLFLGNALAPLGLAGMGGILAGLVLVFSGGGRSG
ncbi:hypothetical protein D3C84_881880 [compost metagenome]